LAAAVKAHVTAKNRELVQLFGAVELDPTAVAAQFVAYAQRLQPHLIEGSVFIDDTLRRGGNVLAEGAQGTFLDIDHGTYPFVTSSSPTAGGVLTGLGVGPRHVRRVIGIAKAFTSRVGSGPFPSELDGEMAARLRGSGDQAVG
jgi:adenylosuccinate synthase